MRSIRRILIANRGEIAVRVIRACRDLGLESVAVYSDADREALHVRYATSAHRLGPAPATESYLDVERVLRAARDSGADAVHPGYGFLAENAAFARDCAAAGLTFIGPSPEVMSTVGDKNEARRIAERAGVPTVPGSPGPVESAAEAAEWADKLGFPVMLKAIAGGGGKGMRRIMTADELESAFRLASSEATSAFGDGRLYLEKLIEAPRHVEIQILADEHGNRVHLGERECSLQRRHQKVLEEAPSPIVDDELRAQMGSAALAIAQEAGYTSAGTVEFLLADGDGHSGSKSFYFIEVNARLQVEHAVTEALTGIDLVAAQIAIAEGRELPFRQEDITRRGHAIECRIYAEDPSNNFAPAPGRIHGLRIPGGPGIRDDSSLYEGYEVPIHYDPLISKLVAWGHDRPSAIARMRRALEEYKVVGIATTIPLFQRVLSDPDFVAGRFDTGYLDQLLATDREAVDLPREEEIADVARLAAALRTFLASEQRAFAPRLGGSASMSAWKHAGRLAALGGLAKC